MKKRERQTQAVIVMAVALALSACWNDLPFPSQRTAQAAIANHIGLANQQNLSPAKRNAQSG